MSPWFGEAEVDPATGTCDAPEVVLLSEVMKMPHGKTLIPFVCAALVAAVVLSTPAAHAGSFGDGVSLEEATPIHEILAEPDAWIGKEVRIEGGVLDVCPKAGCWIEVGEAGESIQIKVDDGVIVFPTDAKGHVASAQGTVEAIEMTREEYLAWLAHVAEEKGETFDEASAEIGEGPFRIFRIRGTGAEIEGVEAANAPAG